MSVLTKKYFLGIFVDLSKAFDTVNHKILIKKLENYGICRKNLLWFRSYLSNRKLYLEFKDNFNEQKSTNLLQIKCGVPQGSILGSLLFLIYINDLFLVSKFLSPIMFVDDPIYFTFTIILKFCLKLQTINWKKFRSGLRLINFH